MIIHTIQVSFYRIFQEQYATYIMHVHHLKVKDNKWHFYINNLLHKMNITFFGFHL